MATIPITIVTGFLGSGKTTLILNLIPQLRAANGDYRVALLKNEFGDVAVDSQLAASSAVAGVRELLNGCICCNLVGQLGDALKELTSGPTPPSRIIIETSGSAFPATLALEVNRLARSSVAGASGASGASGTAAAAGAARSPAYVLDGVVSVIDVENWQGYEDTSYTARLQARYTDLIVFNKWEACDERRFDICLDRLGDLQTGGDSANDVAWVKSRRGWVDAGLVFGIDAGLLSRALQADEPATVASLATKLQGHSQKEGHSQKDDHDHDHDHSHHHTEEVEVLSVTLPATPTTPATADQAAVDADKLLRLLRSAPRDEVYRIKAVLHVAAGDTRLQNSDDAIPVAAPLPPSPTTQAQTWPYILNWAFGRWTFTPMASAHEASAPTASPSALRMTVVLARYQGNKWMKRLQDGDFIALAGGGDGAVTVTKIA